ncbi:hypothetical protein SVAN01_03969 [Stagonosporopsis vannaccii]|nr:hypothetical protein SVAN01_03969 [Stagonosporopsis vannaccii]
MNNIAQTGRVPYRIAHSILRRPGISPWCIHLAQARNTHTLTSKRNETSLQHQKELEPAIHRQQTNHSHSTMASQSTTSPPPPPLRQDLHALFTTLETSFTSTSLGPSRWYLAALAALVGGTEPEYADQLYLYLTSQQWCQTSAARQALVRRLREALVKLVSIVGVCKPLEAVLAVSRVERPHDRDYSSTRPGWTADDANHARGAAWLGSIYAGNTEDTLALFDAHKDFRWISEEITYGLYLSDRQVLDDWDTEVVVLAGIMVQNLRLETRWHVRGALRVGMGKGDVRAIMEAVRAVGDFTGVRLDRVPSVDEVEHEV